MNTVPFHNIIAGVLFLLVCKSVPATLIGISSSVGTVSGADTEPLSVYRIDAATGAATLVTSTQIFGRLLGATFLDNELYVSNIAIGGPAPGPGGGLIGPSVVGTIDLSSGAFTLLNTQGGDINWSGLASTDSAELLYSVDGQNRLLRSMTKNGLISTIGPAISMEGLAFDDEHGILYGLSLNAAFTELLLYTLDEFTGEAHLIGPTGIDCQRTSPCPSGLAYDEFNDILYANVAPRATVDPGISSLYRLDTSIGSATFIGQNGVGRIEGLASIPEPTTLALLSLGLAGLGFSRRKKKT
jgi:hypothetical protein